MPTRNPDGVDITPLNPSATPPYSPKGGQWRELARTTVHTLVNLTGTTSVDIPGLICSPKLRGLPIQAEFSVLGATRLNGAGAGTQVNIQFDLVDENGLDWWLGTMGQAPANTVDVFAGLHRQVHHYRPIAGRRSFKVTARMASVNGQATLYGGNLGRALEYTLAIKERIVA